MSRNGEKMIDYIVVSAPVSPIEANFITANSKFKLFTPTPTGRKSTELKEKGIKEVNVWFNMNSIMNEPLTERTCLLNVTLDMAKLRHKTWEEIQKILTDKLPDTSVKMYNFNRKNDLEWKIKSATFVYNFIGEQAETYYKLLRGGYDLSKSKLKKNVTETLEQETNTLSSVTEYSGITKIESNRYYESVRVRIEYNKTLSPPSDNSTGKNEEEKQPVDSKKDKRPVCDTLCYYPYRVRKDRLQVKVSARRNKIISLCRENGIDRDIKKFLELKDKIDADLFEHYITHITGSGDFYKYKDAEKKIMERDDFSKKEKEKMCDVLRAVASYKGISNYLNHVEDEEPAFKSMLSVRKRAYALTALKNIQKCGINPFTISIRTEIPTEKLDNLVTVYQNEISKEKEVLPQEQPKKEETPPIPKGEGFMDIDEDEVDDIPFS